MRHDDEHASSRRAARPPRDAPTARARGRAASRRVAVERLADEQAVAVLRPARPAADRARSAPPPPPRSGDPAASRRRPPAARAGRAGARPCRRGAAAAARASGRRGCRMLSVATCRRSMRPPVRVVGSAGQRRSTGDATGRANENVEPAPSSDSTQIRPPCCSTTWRAMASPRPVRRRPRRDRAPDRPCRTARRSRPGPPRGTPTPWSSTDGHDLAVSRRDVRTTTSPPSGLNLTALWTRLTTTWPSRALVAADRRQLAGATSTTQSARPVGRRTGEGAPPTSAASAPMSTPSRRCERPAALDRGRGRAAR